MHFLRFIKNVFFLLIYQDFSESAEIALFLNIVFFFLQRKIRFSQKSLLKPYVSMVCEFGVFHLIYGISISIPLTKNQVFRKSVLEPFIYQELGGLGFLGLNPNTQKLFCFNFVTSPSISRQKHIF